MINFCVKCDNVNATTVLKLPLVFVKSQLTCHFPSSSESSLVYTYCASFNIPSSLILTTFATSPSVPHSGRFIADLILTLSSSPQMSSLSIPSTNDNKVESLWLEITNGNNKYIVAGIYRHPNQNIANFNEKKLNNV